jgi:hypothetical protein
MLSAEVATGVASVPEASARVATPVASVPEASAWVATAVASAPEASVRVATPAGTPKSIFLSHFSSHFFHPNFNQQHYGSWNYSFSL